jgi:hypothetical protein
MPPPPQPGPVERAEELLRPVSRDHETEDDAQQEDSVRPQVLIDYRGWQVAKSGGVRAS